MTIKSLVAYNIYCEMMYIWLRSTMSQRDINLWAQRHCLCIEPMHSFVQRKCHRNRVSMKFGRWVSVSVLTFGELVDRFHSVRVRKRRRR